MAGKWLMAGAGILNSLLHGSLQRVVWETLHHGSKWPKRVQGGSCNIFHDLALENIHCHFHNITLATQVTGYPVWEGTINSMNTKRQESLRAILGPATTVAFWCMNQYIALKTLNREFHPPVNKVLYLKVKWNSGTILTKSGWAICTFKGVGIAGLVICR